MTPRALLLDFGAVISVSVFERHRDTEAILGLPANTLTWRGPIDPSTDEPWRRMQRDEITEREYWAIRSREIGELVGEQDWDAAAFLYKTRQANPNSVARPEMKALIEEAKHRGIRVGILSNELELFYGREFLSKISILKSMDIIVDASITQILKPDPRAYTMAIEGLHLPPSEILFVDDQFRNIAGAVLVGLQTQHFELRDAPGSVRAIAARLNITPKELL